MNPETTRAADGPRPSARELELLDAVIGLEARVRELEGVRSSTIDDQLAAEYQLAALMSSYTWRAGRLVTSPIRALRKMLTR